MNNFLFQSCLADIISDFIEQKNLMGHPYKNSALILKRFDAFVKQFFPNDTNITRMMCEKWIEQFQYLHRNTLIRNITPIRQLAKYMNGQGIEAYIIPSYLTRKQIKYQAHIYTTKEKVDFFHATSQIPFSSKSPYRHLIIPIIFRVMYCCGLRESEVLHILMEDINLKTGEIYIRESKGWNCRYVYMTDDLLALCNKYNSEISKLLPQRKAFFPNKNGDIISYEALHKWFHICWDSLEEAKTVNGSSARMHDFRHTFAVDRLNSWIKEGKDINSLCIYLSQFMGHSDFHATDYYLQLVSEFYPELESKLSSVNNNILPEVFYEKE